MIHDDETMGREPVATHLRIGRRTVSDVTDVLPHYPRDESTRAPVADRSHERRRVMNDLQRASREHANDN